METKTTNRGAIVSADLTVADAGAARDFYKAVVGWSIDEMPMKDGEEHYSDYILKDSEGNWAGGVCHHRGTNVGIPPQWIVYINVADVGASVKRCIELGGAVVKESKDESGKYSYAIIRDPFGAILGLTSF